MASLPIKKLAQQPRVTVLPAGAVIPVLLSPTVQADPTLRNPTATLPAVAAALAPLLPAGNAAQQPEKRTRHISPTSIGAGPGEATRDTLDPLSLCLGARNRSEFGDAAGSAPQTDILVYDGAARPATQPGLLVFRDGSYSGPLLPARWVSATATAAFILAYSADPAGYAYTAGDYRRAYVPDAVEEQFFQALFSGGLPAPSSVNGDANWAHVNAANVPTAAIVPAQNSLQGNLTSYRTPPSVDAVNAGLALKANTADVAATIQAITTLDASQTAAIAAAQALLATDGNLITGLTSTQTAQGASIAANTQGITANTAALVPIQKALTIGTNVGNGSQASVQVGGYLNNITGLESGGVAGGGNTVTGNDSGYVAGSGGTISGNNSGAVASAGYNISGQYSSVAAVYVATIRSDNAAAIASRGVTLPLGADYSAAIACYGFTAPAIPQTLFTSQLYLAKNGGGVSLVSPDGATRAVLTLSNTGQLLLNGVAIGSTGSTGSGTAPTITNPTFSGSSSAPTITNPTFSAS